MRKGFTLLEMMVVIGIIAILAGSSMVGYSKVVKSARKARNQELVSNVAAAITQILSDNSNSWPKDLTDGLTNGDGGQLDEKTSRVFVRYHLLGLSYNEKQAGTNLGSRNVSLRGKDRYGIVDADTEALLKRNKRATLSTAVPTGGTVKDHILYYAIDKDGDGIVKVQIGTETLEIRATAVAWAAGPDGVVDYGSRGRNDDVYSWRPSQARQ